MMGADGPAMPEPKYFSQNLSAFRFLVRPPVMDRERETQWEK
jgi:hypothetical protein